MVPKAYRYAVFPVPMPVFCPRCGTLMIKVSGTFKCPRCGYRENEGYEGEEIGEKRDGLFPFSEIREGQREFLEDCRRAVREGRHLIAHAPTGIGKTAAALTAALEDALENDRVVFFLTSKRSQHHIAVETAKKMGDNRIKLVDIISKQEMCPREESRLPYPVFSKMCEEMVKKGLCEEFKRDNRKVVEDILSRPMHVEDVVYLSKRYGVCPYKAALSASEKANLIVCDYSIIFTELSERFFTRLKRPLDNITIIVDEAHNLPERLRMDLKSFLNMEMLKDVRKSLSDDGLFSGILRRLEQNLEERFREIGEKEVEISKEFFTDALESALKGSLEPIGMEEFKTKLQEVGAKKAVDGRDAMPLYLSQFIDVWESDVSKVYVANGSEMWIRCSLLDPSVLSSPIFQGVHSSILMSGTLHPGEMYADILGVPNPIIKAYKSPYPKENKMVVTTEFLTTLYSKRSRRMYQAYANQIVEIARSCPGNVAAFFPSYSIMESVAERISLMELTKEVIMESRSMSKRERTEVIERMKELKESGGALLLAVQGGSFSEGVDYSGNLLSAVAVAGLSIPPPNPETEALRDYYEKKFGRGKGWEYVFISPAINKALQAAGRAIRDAEDRAVIFLMDERFMEERYRRFLPEDMLPKKIRSIRELCREFFQKRGREKED